MQALVAGQCLRLTVSSWKERLDIGTGARPAQQLAKLPTGIEGFDQLSQGGLPRHRTSLIVGGPRARTSTGPHPDGHPDARARRLRGHRADQAHEHELSRRRVPVVAHTSTLGRGDLSRLPASGFDAILEKPAGARAMRECVTHWCLLDSAVASVPAGQQHNAATAPRSPMSDAPTRSAP
jgi:hypothetical protein